MSDAKPTPFPADIALAFGFERIDETSPGVYRHTFTAFDPNDPNLATRLDALGVRISAIDMTLRPGEPAETVVTFVGPDAGCREAQRLLAEMFPGLTDGK